MFDFGTHTRADGDVVAPRTDVKLSQVLGLSDRGRPSEQEMRQKLRGTLEACLRTRAQLFARACTAGGEHGGWVVKRRTGDGMERVEDGHPWRKLLRAPNEYRSAYVYWYWVRLCADLQGQAPSVVRTDGLGTPEALLEVYPSFGYMRQKLNREGGPAGYVYHRRDGQNKNLAPEDVITVRRMDPTSAYGSKSILESLAYEAGSDRAAAEYRQKTYSEGRPPLLYLSTEANIGATKAREQGQRFRNEYLRPNGEVKGVPVFHDGMEPGAFGIDPDTFQMLDSQKLDHDVIFRVTRVNKAYLDQGSNRAEAEQAERSIMTGTIQPLLNEAASQLTLSLRRAFGADESLQVVPPDVTPVDQKEQADIHSTQLESGAKTLNDIRRELGEEEYDMDVADEPLIPRNRVPASMAGASPAEGAERGSWAPEDDPGADPADFL